MKESNTSERLKYIMETQCIKQVDILEKCKPFCAKYGVRLAKNDLSQYVSGKVEPKQDKLSILGLALNVSEAWLSGYNVPMSRSNTRELNDISKQLRTEKNLNQSDLASDFSLNDEEKEIIIEYRSLDEENQKTFRRLLEYATKFQELYEKETKD